MQTAPISSADTSETIVKDVLRDGLSVVVPVFRLAERLPENLSRLRQLLDGWGTDYEVLAVDDGSDDGSGALLAAAVSDWPQLQVLLRGRNGGKGAAVLEGATKARFGWVLMIDGDLDIAPERLPEFCAEVRRTGADIVIGSKRHPRSRVCYPLRRRLASVVYHCLTGCLLGLGLSDTQTGMKLFRKAALDYALGRLMIKRFAFDLELLAVAQNGGFRIAEAPVTIDFGVRWGCLSPAVTAHTLRDTLAILYRARFLHYYEALSPLPPLPTDGSAPRFSIIVACPGDSAVLRRLIAALCRQTYRNFEVLFLPDRLLVRPEVNYRFRIVATGRVRPARKRNMGAVAASGEVLAFIDDDAYPRPDWLAVAAARFAAHNGEIPMDALGGPGLTPPDDPPAARLSGDIFASPLVSGNFRYRYFIQGVLRKIEDFPSCNLFVRKSAFDEIRGFREDFWPGEDTLLCADLQAAGHSLWYDPRLVVYHHRRPVWGPHLRQVGRYALHRGYFARRIGSNSRRISYMLPTLFLLGVVFGLPAACIFPLLWIPYLSVLMLYLLALVADAIVENSNPRRMLPFFVGILTTHFVYGARFLQGFFARRMPCGVVPFDHR